MKSPRVTPNDAMRLPGVAAEIDRHVYALYQPPPSSVAEAMEDRRLWPAGGLTPDEIKIVEGAVK